MKKRFFFVGGVVLVAVLTLCIVINMASEKPEKKTSDTKPDDGRRTSILEKVVPPLSLEAAEREQNKGDYKTALELFSKLKEEHPRWSVVYLKMAACQVALHKDQEAIKNLRIVLEMETSPEELRTQARATLQELLLP